MTNDYHSNGSPNSSSGWNGWVPIIILFCVGLWPVALFLLGRKLIGYDNTPSTLARMVQNLFSWVRDMVETDQKKRRKSRHPYDIEQEQQQAWEQAQQTQWQAQEQARQAQWQAQEQAGQAQEKAQEKARQAQEKAQEKARQAQEKIQEKIRQAQQKGRFAQEYGQASSAPPPGPAPKGGKKPNKKQPKVKVPRGRALTFIGACVAGVFGLGFVSELLDGLTYPFREGLPWDYLLRYEYSELVPLLGFFTAGLVMFFYGISRTRKGRRFRKYLPLIGKQTSVSIDALAKAAGKRRRRVMKDLQEMLDIGLLGAGYLDLSRDRLVLSDEGISDEEEPSPQPEPEPPQDDYAVLLEIKQVNDAIPDPIMSAKIDRIGEITGKILDYQRQNPGKDHQLRSFLNYYLPTTLKILRAYAQLDAQGVEGENISAAKERIEGMMDKVVEGFEKQLDELFRDRAMDITSDVSVLEQMLEKDGLSGQSQGFTLGG